MDEMKQVRLAKHTWNSPAERYYITEKRLDFDSNPIGEADIELELQMN